MIIARGLLSAIIGAAGMVGPAFADAADSLPAATAPHGAIVFQRCAACHLPTGEGVPGSFPPLAGRLAAIGSAEAGRSYMVMVVSFGLMGAIEVDGQPYMGVMPAQAGLTDEDVAAVLNYAMGLQSDAAKSKNAIHPFTKEEVAAIRAKYVNFDPYQVHGLRAAALAVFSEAEKPK